MWFFGKHVLVFHIALCLGMLIRYVRGIEVLDNTLTYWLYRLAYIMHHVFFLIGWLESSCNSNNIFRQCELDRSNIVVFTSAHEHIKNIVNLRWNSHTQTHVGKHVCTHASRTGTFICFIYDATMTNIIYDFAWSKQLRWWCFRNMQSHKWYLSLVWS